MAYRVKIQMHINIFLEICDLFKQNGVSDDAIKLRLFPFSLRNKARVWLNSMPAGTFTSWNILAEKFLARYFPLAKTAKMRNDITLFMQSDNESLYEAWEKYKDMIRRCHTPNPGCDRPEANIHLCLRSLNL